MTWRSWSPNRRGVSDLVGFAVVFGIVVLSIALVYTFGVSALTEVQHSEAVNNAGRAFEILADNMADIHRNGAPGRSTELDFESGELAMTGDVTMNVNTNSTFSTSIVPSSIRYTTGESGYYYTSGAVVRTGRTSASIVHEPPFRFSHDRIVVSMVETKEVGNVTAIGGGSVRVSARSGGTTVETLETGGVKFNISVSSPRYEAWHRYLTSQQLEPKSCDVTPATNTVDCHYVTEQVYVRRTVVRVRLTN